MAGPKILIVEDEQELLQSLAHKLTLREFDVITASSGCEAVEKARTESPAVILLDIMLPDIDGPQVACRLQDDPATRTIPIIFLSGIISREEAGADASPEIQAGERFYTALAKPFSLIELLDELNKLPL